MEYVLQHLGPSAQPLISFLYRGEAAKFLMTSKFIGELVSAYQKRYRFINPIFIEDSFGYQINKNGRYSYLPSLEPGEYFFLEVYYNDASRLWRYIGDRPLYYSSHFFDPNETIQVASEMRAHGYKVVTSRT
jgi:hypothetical protein